MLPILPRRQIPPRFFRVHFLTALGLLAVAGFFHGGADRPVLAVVRHSRCPACLVGSIVWHLDEAPLGRACGSLRRPIALAACLIYGGMLCEVPARFAAADRGRRASALGARQRDDGDADGAFVPDFAGDDDGAA